MQLKKTIQIGRAPDNQVIINSPALAEHHAKIEIYDNDEVYISEMEYDGMIWVNGINVKRKLISTDCDITICGLKIDLKKLVEPARAAATNQEVPKEIEEKFMALKTVYNEYVKNRKQYLKKQNLTAILTVPINFIPMVGYGASQVVRSLITNPIMLQEIEEAFRIKYICVYTDCSMPWGNTPWENIYARKTCPYCKKLLRK